MRKNAMIVYLLIGIFCVLLVYCIWNSYFKKENMTSVSDTKIVASPKVSQISQTSQPVSIQDELIEGPSSESELIQDVVQDAYTAGFGVGPGLYGSGRHTSEFVGN